MKRPPRKPPAPKPPTEVEALEARVEALEQRLRCLIAETTKMLPSEFDKAMGIKERGRA